MVTQSSCNFHSLMNEIIYFPVNSIHVLWSFFCRAVGWFLSILKFSFNGFLKEFHYVCFTLLKFSFSSI